MLEQILIAFNEAILVTCRGRAFKVAHNTIYNGISPENAAFQIVIPAIYSMINFTTESSEESLLQYFITSKIGAKLIPELRHQFYSQYEKLNDRRNK